MGENFFLTRLWRRFIFPALPLPGPGPVQLRGASLLSLTLGRTLEMGVFGRQPGPDPAPSPWTPWPCWIMLTLPSSPSPPTARPEVPSDQAWPAAQPAFGYWLNGL